jgi:hypothetical protein
MAKSRQEIIYEGMSPEDVAEFEADASNAPAQPQPDGNEGVADPGGAETPAAAQESPAQPQMVDVRAVQEARAAQRAAEQEAAKIRNEYAERSRNEAVERAKLEERISLINQAIESQGKPQTKTPTKDEDPLGYYDHQLEAVNGKFQTIEQELKAYKDAEQQRIQANQIETQRSALIDEAQAVINVAAQSKPELQEAMEFALNGIRSEIVQMLDAQQVHYAQRAAYGEQIWRNSMANLAQRCPKDPERAAEFVLSNARYYGYGFQPQQVATQPQPTGQPAPQSVQQPTMQQRQEQQQRHLSLSGTQGGQPPATLDAKTLANMSDEDFVALKKSVEGRKKIQSIQMGN